MCPRLQAKLLILSRHDARPAQFALDPDPESLGGLWLTVDDEHTPGRSLET